MASSIQTNSLTQNYINGAFTNGTDKKMDVLSPMTGNVISEVVLSSYDDLDKAVQSAQASLPSWSSKTLKERVQVFFKFRQLLEQNIDELTELVCLENGKINSEARAEVLKGIELCEFACSLPQLINDEIQEVSKGVECRTSHVPVGVVASITPFNFPHMVPLWTIPNAIV